MEKEGNAENSSTQAPPVVHAVQHGNPEIEKNATKHTFSESLRESKPIRFIQRALALEGLTNPFEKWTIRLGVLGFILAVLTAIIFWRQLSVMKAP